MPEFRDINSIKERPTREEDLIQFWKDRRIFEQSGELTREGRPFVFYEGPPTANGRPGIHHVLSRVFKDIYIRYFGQRGFHVPRRAGWDCHGLPVEREVEKALGIESKSEIEEKYGIGKFNTLCRESVLKYVDEWNRFSERMAFWVDLNDPYFTMDDDFIESVWSLLKIIWDRGLIYQGYRVVPYDPVLGATMSDAEVDQGYKETDDPSVTVRFRVRSAETAQKLGYNPDQKASFLVWTTTPWTLPSNTALALAAEETYVIVERIRPEDEVDAGTTEILICAEALYEQVFSGFQGGAQKNAKQTGGGPQKKAGKEKAKSGGAKTQKKSDAQSDEDSETKSKSDGQSAKKPEAKAGKKTKANSKKKSEVDSKKQSPGKSTKTGSKTSVAKVSIAAAESSIPSVRIIKKVKGSQLAGIEYEQLLDYIDPDSLEKEKGKRGFYTVTADFVTMDTGTGIVHIAPAYGADDLAVGQQHNLPIIHAVGLDGKFIKGTPHADVFFKDADKLILRELKERGIIWKSERYVHSYPFGYRTGAPLLYFAKNAWYIRTTDLKDRLIKNNAQINWVPEHIKDGRFGNWLINNRDWALSRERYWGTPLPVWTDADGEVLRIIGSRAELSELSGRDCSALDLHRPHVDEIEIKDPQTGKTLRRVPEVIDCWFDSGAMPYAQWGWPEKGKAEFERYFPADFISEAIDQTRGWFYTLLSISTMVSDAPAYKNVVCLGHVVDEKGEKMSKSKGNVVDPFSVFDTHGADGIRWYFLTNSPPGHSRRVGKPGTDHDPVNIVHGFFNMLMNSVGFFIMYANVDGIRIQSDWEANPIQGAPPFADRPEIDRWILSALTDLIDTVGKALDTYDCQSAGKAMEDFVDGLSNWYIRRNRRRFWKGDLDADKLAAYATLYECLTAIARMMAPFTPFLSEDLYRLLVSDVVADAPESVHLAGWPAHHAGQYDAGALRAGDLIKQAAYLGRAARMQSAIKVRQPLGRMMIHLDEKADRQLIAQNEAVLCEELNVKHIEYLDDSAGILDYRVKPNLPRIGKALGPRVREVQQYLQQADAREIALAVRKGQTVIIPAANAEPIELEPDDILIESVSKEGTSGAEGRGMLVALDTTLTDELIQEGYARDLVRNIQELRKNSGLEVTDRIGLSIEVGEGKLSADLNKAIQTHVAYIEGETLAQLQSGPRPGNIDGQENVRIEKHPVEIALWKK